MHADDASIRTLLRHLRERDLGGNDDALTLRLLPAQIDLLRECLSFGGAGG
jgi:hypothetical protein